MPHAKLTRRTLLRGGAGAAITLPAFVSLGQRPEAQAAGTGPERLVVYAQPLSIYAPEFWPTAPGQAPYDLPSTPLPDVYVSGEGAMNNPDFMLPPMLESLAPFRDELLLIEGLDNCRGNHGAYSATLTGSGDHGTSIDQHIAAAIGGDSKFASLQVGVFNRGAENKEAVSWYAAGQAAPAEADPSILFDRLFADLETDPEAALMLQAQQKSILDAALGQAQDVRGRLSTTDKTKLDNYLDSVREVEQRIASMPPVLCEPPPAPGLPPVAELTQGSTAGGNDLVPDFARAQADLLAMALACGLTRVATYQMLYEANNYSFPWLNISTRHHDMSHLNGDPSTWTPDDGIARALDYVAMSTWSIEQVAYLVQRLVDLDAFEGTTLLFFVPMGNGQRHNDRNIPLMLIGSGGGTFATGRHVRYDRSGEPRAINDLLVTLGQCYGADIDTIGDDELNQGPLVELLTG